MCQSISFLFLLSPIFSACGISYWSLFTRNGKPLILFNVLSNFSVCISIEIWYNNYFTFKIFWNYEKRFSYMNFNWELTTSLSCFRMRILLLLFIIRVFNLIYSSRWRFVLSKFLYKTNFAKFNIDIWSFVYKIW